MSGEIVLDDYCEMIDILKEVNTDVKALLRLTKRLDKLANDVQPQEGVRTRIKNAIEEHKAEIENLLLNLKNYKKCVREMKSK